MAIKVFKIEAWKAERWNQQTLPNDGVNDAFENLDLSEVVNNFLTHHQIADTDLISVNISRPDRDTRRDIGSLDIWLTCRMPAAPKEIPQVTEAQAAPRWTSPAPLDQISRIWVVKIDVNMAEAIEHAIGKRHGKYVNCPTGQKVSGTLDYIHEHLKAQRCEPMNWATNDPTVYEVWSKP